MTCAMWDNDMKRTSSYLATWSQYRSSGTIGSSILKVLVTDTEVIWFASVAVTRHKVLSFLWWVIISPHLLQCTRQECLWSYHMGQWQYPQTQLQGSSYRVAHHQMRWRSKPWLRNCWSWEPILSSQKSLVDAVNLHFTFSSTLISYSILTTAGSTFIDQRSIPEWAGLLQWS